MQIHDPSKIHMLFCGNPSTINFDDTSPPYTPPTKQKLSTFYDFPEPINPNEPVPTQSYENEIALKKKKKSEKILEKLKEDELKIKNVQSYLHIYRSNHQRKALKMHQDLEEGYFQPIHKKLAQQITGPNYTNYRRSKSEALELFNKQINTPGEGFLPLPYVPSIEIDTTDIHDPIQKYRNECNKEDQLIKVLEKQTGKDFSCCSSQPVSTFPSTRTKCSSKMPLIEPYQESDKDTVLKETRLFNDGPPQNIPKGKKIFNDKWKSGIPQMISCWPPSRLAPRNPN